MEDFFSDRSKTKLLEIECDFSDEYLIGHAKRVGLAGERTTQATLNRLLPTIRNDMTHESDRIRDANFEPHLRIQENLSPEENADRISAFLDIPHDRALQVAQTEYLFAD
jgi:hypothetical protein